MQTNSTQPFIDVSIVTFNSAKWLDAFFCSLNSQAYPLDKVKLWIRDNGSTDETVAYLREWQSKLLNLAGLEIECGENVGFGRGHNCNLAKGTAPYILVTNVDLTFESDAIEQVILQAVRDDASVASWEFRQKPFEHPKYYNPVTLETTWSSSACILFKRTSLDEIGGYEPRIFLYGEDVEISFRLRDKGYLLKYCPSAVCWHYSYSEVCELKPLQMLGSTLANCYIRMRYGNMLDVLAIPFNLLFLVLMPQRFQGQRLGQLKNAWNVMLNALYFLTSRKRSRQKFPINGMDYERVRQGAFYENKQLKENCPLVSIVVRTYGGRLSCLKEAVTSILNQTYDNIELVVIEDGSETAKCYIDEISSINKLTAVRYQSIPKGGRCKAGNAGLAISTGQHINFLDDDDLFFADHIEVLLQSALNNSKMVATYSVAWEVRTEVISKEEWQYKELSYEVVYQEPYNLALLMFVNYIPIQSILFKRTLYEKYGGFNENLPVLEDWELWLRYAANSEFLFVNKLTSLYRVPSNNKDAAKRWRTLNASYNEVLHETNSVSLQVTVGEVRQIVDQMAVRALILKAKKNELGILLRMLPFATVVYRGVKWLYKIISGATFNKSTHN